MTAIGIDMGGVIANTFYGPFMNSLHYRTIKPVTNALPSIKTLVKKHSAKNVFIISKASTQTQANIRDLLRLYDFFAITGFLTHNVYFCTTTEGKKPIAQKLGITHFIDDRHRVLAHVEEVVEHCMLFGPQRKKIECSKHIYTPTWEDVLRHTQ